MKRSLASALAIVTSISAALGGAALSGSARADDITLDDTPFKSTRSRAEVLGELISQPVRVSAGADEWALQGNGLHGLKSTYTSQQARSDYKFSREQVHALTAEDSGSSYFKRSVAAGNPTSVMGGPARVEIYGDESE